MNEKNFFFLAGIIFSIITLLHILRVIYGWNAIINDWSVPMGISWIAIIVGGYLGYQGLKLSKK